MKKEIIINASKDRSRIAIVEDGELVELYVENPENVRTIGNIYLGEVQKVMPAIRAAFVDLGEKQDAFLHFSDLTENAAQLFAMAGEDVPGLEAPVLARAPQKRVADDENEPDVEDTLEVDSGDGESAPRARRSTRSRRGRGRGRGRGRRREEEEEQEERRRKPMVIDLTSSAKSAAPKPAAPKRAPRSTETDTRADEPAEAPARAKRSTKTADAPAADTPTADAPTADAPASNGTPAPEAAPTEARPRRRSRSRSRSARPADTPAADVTEADASAADAPTVEADAPEVSAPADDAPKSARSRSRSRGNESAPAENTATADEPASDDTPEARSTGTTDDDTSDRPRRRSRSRGGRRGRGASDADAGSSAESDTSTDDADEATSDKAPKPARSRRRSRGADHPPADETPEADASEATASAPAAEPQPKKPSRSRRRGPAVVDLTSGAKSKPKPPTATPADDADDEADAPAPRSRRSRRDAPADDPSTSTDGDASEASSEDDSTGDTGRSRSRSRGRGRSRSRSTEDRADDSAEASDDASDTSADDGRSRGRGRSAETDDASASDDRSSRRRSRSDDDGSDDADSGRSRRGRRGRASDDASDTTADDSGSGRSRSGRRSSSDESSEDSGSGRSDAGRSRGGSGRSSSRSDSGRSDSGRSRGGSGRGRDAGRGRSGGRSGSTNQNVPPAQELLKRGSRVLVKVTKEPISSKGSRVSTDISLAGRFLVLVPAADYIAVSKKIESSKERRRLKSLAQSLKPDDCGVIVRTVAEGRDAKSLDTDLRLLIEKWDGIKAGLAGRPKPPKTLYTDVNMVSSIIRDLFSEDFDRILIDDPKVYKNVKAYVQAVAPDMADNVVLHKTKTPIYRSVGLEKQVEEAFSRRVNMKGGGYLFIETTEAMHVVDVNSGRAGRGKSQKENLMAVNLESAREIAKQLRLRDLGGIIVVDFIDLRHESDRRKVTDELKKQFQKDRAVTKVLPMSDFGLVQITRQRLRPSITANANVTDDDGQPLDAADAAMAAGAGEIPQSARRSYVEEEPAAEAPARPTLSPEEVTPAALAARVRGWLDHYRTAVDERYRGRPVVVRVHPLLGEFLRRGFISTLTRWRLGLRGVAFRIEEDASIDPLTFDVRDEKSGRSLLSKYSA